MLKGLVLFFFSGLIIISIMAVSKAQELDCNVVVDYKQLATNQGTETQIFEQMKKDISTFINKREWTEDRFEPEERIKCNLVITLTQSPSQNYYLATSQFQILRPIYNTDYESVSLSYIDRNFNFTYTPSQPFDYNPNVFTNDLVGMLAFYAHLALAIDYDSFAKLGGENYIEKTFDLVNIAQQSNDAGWKQSGDSRNRYWLAENLMSQQLIPFREALYQYHRLALDRFLVSPENARKQILATLYEIEKVIQLRPATVLINSFFDSKSEELMSIYKEAPLEMRRELYELLIKLDPGRSPRYMALIN